MVLIHCCNSRCKHCRKIYGTIADPNYFWCFSERAYADKTNPLIEYHLKEIEYDDYDC